MDDNFYCVIMAGGVGSRFWPVSRNSRPKQFLDILGTGRTFLQMTYDRFIKIIPAQNILVVTSSIYKNLVKKQLPDILPENILLEPHRRNTAPCITYAAWKIKVKNPNATMVVAPSDHFISNEDLFLDTIQCALKYASNREELFTIGIKPTRPETGYGYIQCNLKDSETIDGNLAYSVKTFTEKPNAELAKVFVESGEFLWNSGIFIWSVKMICKAIEHWLPEVYILFKSGEKYYNTPREQRYINKIYEDCTSISIDYGVMEKTSRAHVFQASFGWSDLGTWESLFFHCDKDVNNNYIKVGDNMIDDTKNSIIVSEEKGKLVVVKGLDGFMVINTDDVLLVAPRDEAKFKTMITDLAVKDKSKFQ